MKKSLFLILLITFVSCDYISETKEVGWEETRPKVLLKKYEYFKDISSRLDEQLANIQVYKVELTDSTLTNENKQQRKSEMLGIISNYNHLASEYNSQMSKINYQFCNVGEMPLTNMEPLPREFKPYILTTK
jgi:hypothetical protein